MRAIGPVTCSVSHTQSVGCVGTSPTDGRRPVMPQNAAGMRSEPPRSVPSASAIMPVASAAAPPPVDPPADFVGSHGFRVRPNTSLNVFAPAANSGQFVLPRMIGARFAQPADDERILLRHVVCVNRRAERGPQARNGRDVLDPDRQPAQRSGILALLDPAIELHGVFERLRIQRDDGVQRGIELLHALEAGFDRLGDGHFSRRDSPAQLGRR